jgi:hypothetical protein
MFRLVSTEPSSGYLLNTTGMSHMKIRKSIDSRSPSVSSNLSISWTAWPKDDDITIFRNVDNYILEHLIHQQNRCENLKPRKQATDWYMCSL